MLHETLGQMILGGAMIGLSLALLMVLTGRIMSATGMVGSLLGGREGLAATSIAFLAGLFVSAFVLSALAFAEKTLIEADLALLMIGGVLVGIGARLGNSSLFGSICGMARGSVLAVQTLLALALGAIISSALVQFVGVGIVS